MRSGTDCERCQLGLLEDGTPCDCSFGLIRKKQEEQTAHLRAGHGESLPLDVIPTRYRNNEVADLARLFSGEPSKLIALDWIGNWAAETWAVQKRRSLFLHGPVGTGKTTLAMFALKLFMGNGHRGDVLFWTEWITELGALDFQAKNAAILDTLKVPVLVIDDLGSQDRMGQGGRLQVETTFRLDTVRTIINGRMNKGVPTIITTNLSVSQFQDQFGERVSSRIAEDFQIVEVNGTDIREKQGVNA